MSYEDFHEIAQQLLLTFDQLYSDHPNIEDSQLSDGVLTFTTLRFQKIIISRQSPVKEIWVATPGGGFHFRWDAQKQAWLDKDHQELEQFIQETIQREN